MCEPLGAPGADIHLGCPRLVGQFVKLWGLLDGHQKKKKAKQNQRIFTSRVTQTICFWRYGDKKSFVLSVDLCLFPQFPVHSWKSYIQLWAGSPCRFFCLIVNAFLVGNRVKVKVLEFPPLCVDVSQG